MAQTADPAAEASPAATPPPSPQTGGYAPAMPEGGQAATPEPPAFVAPSSPDASPNALVLDRPLVDDTARLSSAGQVAPLFGIVGMADPGHGLQSFIRAAGDRVTCQPMQSGTYQCLLPDRTDVALVSLANGAARSTADAPDSYRAQEEIAQAARRGLWANLPPPPATLLHPTARTSAILVSGEKTYPLDGLVGRPGQPAHDLQAYIAAHGDSLLCQQQGAGHYLCTLPDGTDIGKVALVNGAAEVAQDAPDSYRLQQAEAMANHRGIWGAFGSPPGPAEPVIGYPVEAPPAYVLSPADVAGPVSYVGDQPTAVIDGETVFFVFGAGLGWGYYDHFHHWRGAPDRFVHHLDRFHPDGRGLRGYAGSHEELRGAPPGSGRPDGPREERPGGFHDEGRREFGRGAAPGLPRPGPSPVIARPGQAPVFARPGLMAFGRPAGPPPMAMRSPPIAAARPPPPVQRCAGRGC